MFAACTGSCAGKNIQLDDALAVTLSTRDLNSEAGRSLCRLRFWSRLQPLAEKTVITEYPGHAAELALNASAYGGSAAAGGDGTGFRPDGLIAPGSALKSSPPAEETHWRGTWVCLTRSRVSTQFVPRIRRRSI